jgi:hypothetical protein
MLLSCGGHDSSVNPQSEDICACSPSTAASSDYRHAAKHVPLPAGTADEITVDTVLGRPDGEPAFDAPRSGRELKLFHIAHAFLQFAWVRSTDCDVTMEIAGTADRNAPRVILETPVDSEYCSSRRSLQQQLAQFGEQVNKNSGELKEPRPVDVLGLAFQDFDHTRGSPKVATTWELHPAVVKVLSQ